MKLVLFVLATVLALQACSATTAKQDEKDENDSKECFAETGADKELYKKLVTTLDDELLAENDKLKRYLVCLFKKQGIFDANSAVQKEGLRASLASDYTAEEVDQVVKKCAVQKDTAWETAYEMRKCVQSEASQY